MRNAIDSWLLSAAIIIMTISCCYSDIYVIDEENCQPFGENETKALCIPDGNNSTPTNISLECPDSFNVLILSAWVHESISGGLDNCTTHNPNNAMCFELTAGMHRCLDNQCNLTVPAGDLCAGSQNTSTEIHHYAYVVFRCQSQFAQYKNATTISTESSAIVSDSVIAVRGQAKGMIGSVSYTQNPSNCSAIIPRNTSAIIGIYFMQVKYDPGRQRSDFNDTPPCIYAEETKGQQYDPVTGLNFSISVIIHLCSVCVRELLEYSPVERFVKISYQKESPRYFGPLSSNISVDFIVYLQASNSSNITIQCNNPPFPLVFPTSSSLPPARDRSTTASPTSASERILVTSLIVIMTSAIGGLIAKFIAQ